MRYIFSVLLTVSLITCGTLVPDGKRNKNTPTMTLLGLALINSGSPVYTINFKINASGQKDITCGIRVTGHEGGYVPDYSIRHISESTNISLRDARFYVHDINLIKQDGTKTEFNLTADGKWQTARVAILDFENASGDCSTGTTETNAKLVGSATAGNYNAVEFKIGVPSDLNFLDNKTQASPLNINSMYESSTVGYKFLKFDFYSKEGAGTSNSVHLGSENCSNGSCSYSNIPTITARKYDKTVINFEKQKVAFDIYGLLIGTNTNLTATPAGSALTCLPGNTTSSCKKPLNNLGVNETDGKSLGTQSTFYVE